ncbi:hypothetical protein CDIK_0807 [Cucumispora dikerogammari]|nr:hypothetical protein CDIK_0807 [Cucumispora dikerogammari]
MDYFNLQEILTEDQHLSVKFPTSISLPQLLPFLSAKNEISLPLYIIDFLLSNEHCELLTYADSKHIIDNTTLNELKANSLFDLNDNITFSSLNKEIKCKYVISFIIKIYQLNNTYYNINNNSLINKEILNLHTLMCDRFQFMGGLLFHLDIGDILSTGSSISNTNSLYVTDISPHIFDSEERKIFDESKRVFKEFYLFTL